MWAIRKGSVSAVEYTSASTNQNTQSRWRSAQSEPANLETTTCIPHRTQKQNATNHVRLLGTTAGECVASADVKELQEKDKGSQTIFKH